MCDAKALGLFSARWGSLPMTTLKPLTTTDFGSVTFVDFFFSFCFCRLRSHAQRFQCHSVCCSWIFPANMSWLVMNFTGQVLLPVTGFQVSAAEDKGFTLCHLHPQELNLCIMYSKLWISSLDSLWMKLFTQYKMFHGSPSKSCWDNSLWFLNYQWLVMNYNSIFWKNYSLKGIDI